MSDDQAAKERAEFNRKLLEGGAATLRWALAGSLFFLVLFSGLFSGFLYFKDDPQASQIVGFLGIIVVLLILVVAIVVALAKVNQAAAE